MHWIPTAAALIEQKEWHNFKSAHGMAGPEKRREGEAFHPTDLPDPSAYMVHLGDIDKDGNDALSWEEFKGHFPNADISVFEAIDHGQGRQYQP